MVTKKGIFYCKSDIKINIDRRQIYDGLQIIFPNRIYHHTISSIMVIFINLFAKHQLLTIHDILIIINKNQLLQKVRHSIYSENKLHYNQFYQLVYFMIDLKKKSQYRIYPQETSIEDSVIVYNVCGKFTLSSKHLDLSQLSQKMMNASYNRKRLPALIIRKCTPKSTIILFHSGRGLIIGAQECNSIETTVKKLAKQLARAVNMRRITVEQFQITNIMAVCQLGFEVDIGKLSEDKYSIKNDNISGVVFRYGPQLKKSIIHRSGKVVICGLKSLTCLMQGFKAILNSVQKYKFFQSQNSKSSVNYLLS